jgi:hypothetical protein
MDSRAPASNPCSTCTAQARGSVSSWACGPHRAQRSPKVNRGPSREELAILSMRLSACASRPAHAPAKTDGRGVPPDDSAESTGGRLEARYSDSRRSRRFELLQETQTRRSGRVPRSAALCHAETLLAAMRHLITNEFRSGRCAHRNGTGADGALRPLMCAKIYRAAIEQN